MASLRMRIALLLVASIVSVVALATLAAISVLGRPPLEPALVPVAKQIQTFASMARLEKPATRLDIREKPAGGIPDDDYATALSNVLKRDGVAYAVRVTQEVGRVGRTASVALPDQRWLIVPVSDLSPPRNPWVTLSGWISLIAIGAGVVSFYFAAVLTRPLEILEEAVARVGSDGILATLPEKGSGEVRATARALNHLSARLKSSIESRMRLVAAAGHDFRTPMTRMRLRAEFLSEDEREAWLKDLEELERIADSAIRLVREETAADTPKRISLSETVRELIIELTAVNYKVAIGQDEQVYVCANSLALRRALRNLLVNAATHGKECQVDVLARSGKATVNITDSGPGIPPELINKAFEPFFRVDPARRQSVPGAGLGLAIAKEIIERYGGTIVLRNRVGGGLEQTVTFNAA